MNQPSKTTSPAEKLRERLRSFFSGYNAGELHRLYRRQFQADETEQGLIRLRVSHAQKNKLPETLREGSHPIQEYLAAQRHILVRGAPGSGKTTLLKQMALALTAERKFPVFLHLPDVALNSSLADAAATALEAYGKQPRWFEDYLNRGQCVVLLDGLDEIPDHTKAVRWIEDGITTFPRNQFVITSALKNNVLKDVLVLEVHPLTTGQIQQFIQNETLYKMIQESDSLAEMASNPLLLSMMATVFRQQGSLPQRRADLYAAMLSETQSQVAFERMQQGVYTFAHKSFQDYLAAVHIKENHLEKFLLEQIENNWWHETIRFYCAIADATPIIQACLKKSNLLMLAVECAGEALRLKPDVRRKLKSKVEQDGWARLKLRMQSHDDSPVTPAEYQLFVEEMLHHDAASSPHLLGVRQSYARAFADWLSQQNETWGYRLPEPGELPAKEYGHWTQTGFEGNIPQPTELIKAEFNIETYLNYIFILKNLVGQFNHFAHTVSRAIAQSNDLDQTLALAGELDRTVEQTRSRVNDLDLALDRTSTFASNRELSSASLLTSDLALGLARFRPNEFVRAVPSVREIALNLARALDPALDFVAGIAQPNVHTDDLTRARNRIVTRMADESSTGQSSTRELDRVIALADELVTACEIALDLDFNRDNLPASKLTRVETFILEGILRFPSYLDLDKVVPVLSSREDWEGQDLLSYRIKILSELSYQVSDLLNDTGSISRRSYIQELEQTIPQNLFIYQQLLLLKLRRAGLLPAYEGIRLVRERKQE